MIRHEKLEEEARKKKTIPEGLPSQGASGAPPSQGTADANLPSAADEATNEPSDVPADAPTTANVTIDTTPIAIEAGGRDPSSAPVERVTTPQDTTTASLVAADVDSSISCAMTPRATTSGPVEVIDVDSLDDPMMLEEHSHQDGMVNDA